MRRLTLGLLLAVFPPGSAFAQVPDGFGGAWRMAVAEHQRDLERERVVGAVVAFVHDGRLIAADYFGSADLETGRPVDEHTVWHWASITKTFTAVSIMQLRDHGLLSLDDPAVRWVPELARVHDPYGPVDDITLRMLLSHTAGFRGPTWPWGAGERWEPFEPTDWSQLAAMMPYTQVLFPPGSRYSYSNPGIAFLGRTLEAATGDVYESYVDKNIFDALGMDTAYFDRTPWRLENDRSNRYRIVQGRPVAGGPDFNTGVTVSNSGLNATIGDMAKWAAFLMGAPASRAAVHDQVLDRASLEEMWRPVAAVPDSLAGRPVSIGLSFFLLDDAGHPVVFHTGDQASFRSFLLVEPDARVALIGAYNTDGGDDTAPDVDGIMQRVQKRALDALFPRFRPGP